MRVNHRVCLSEVADFQIDNLTFEVGGQNKTRRQLTAQTDAYVVKDDIEYGFNGTIPLWSFGFNY